MEQDDTNAETSETTAQQHGAVTQEDTAPKLPSPKVQPLSLTSQPAAPADELDASLQPLESGIDADNGDGVLTKGGFGLSVEAGDALQLEGGIVEGGNLIDSTIDLFTESLNS